MLPSTSGLPINSPGSLWAVGLGALWLLDLFFAGYQQEVTLYL